MEQPLRTKRKQLAALEKFEKFNMLTPQGKNWLIAATDPFHDSPLTLEGYPDLNVAGSIVQCVKKSTQISCPSGITTGTWDCNMVLWPVGNSMVGLSANCFNGSVVADSTTSAPFNVGGFGAVAVGTGNSTFFNANSGGATGIYNVGTVSLDNGTDGYLAGISRVIGMGFEVVNTTAPLYKQGQVIVWRQPVNSMDNTSVMSYGSGTNYAEKGKWKTQKFPSPPQTTQTALLLEGSAQWSAEYGAYCVATMNSLNNFAAEPDPVMPLVFDSEEVIRDGGSTAVMYCNTNTITIGTTQVVMPQTTTMLPFNMSGAFFSGLSLQTTFTVNITWFVERFPTPFDTQLVVLADPSPGWDQFALELYTAAMRDMPAGVRVDENPLGEWFQDVVNKVASNASPVLNALSVVHPGFGLAGQAAGMIAKATEPVRKAAKPQTLSASAQPMVMKDNKNRPKPKKVKPKSPMKTA